MRASYVGKSPEDDPLRPGSSPLWEKNLVTGLLQSMCNLFQGKREIWIRIWKVCIDLWLTALSVCTSLQRKTGLCWAAANRQWALVWIVPFQINVCWSIWSIISVMLLLLLFTFKISEHCKHWHVEQNLVICVLPLSNRPVWSSKIAF